MNLSNSVDNAFGGLRGGTNFVSWIVAGTLAYCLWIKPQEDLRREQEERAEMDRDRYSGKRAPISNVQETGVIYENKAKINDFEN